MTQDGFSSLGLSRLRLAMASAVERGDRPGIAVLVARNGEVHMDAIGSQDIDGQRPMAVDTIFRIASITKPIVAAATLRLVEQGRLALDEPIDRLIPEMANRRVLKSFDGPLHQTEPASRPIVVRDLLTMRMGMGAIMAPGRYPVIEEMMRLGIFTPFRMPTASSADEWIDNLARIPLMDQPGQVWRYDVSFTLLGALIERATGSSLGESLNELIFHPLQMVDTGFFVPPNKLHRLPVAYQRNAQTGNLEVWDPSGRDSVFAREPGFAGGHGGLVSTLSDYHAFTTMLLSNGEARGRRILAPACVKAMMSDQIPDDVKARSTFIPGFWENRGWGFGGSVVTRHEAGGPRGFGWDGGYGTVAYWDGDTGVTAILLSQRLLDSPVLPAVFHEFFECAYTAAGVL